MMKKVAVAVLCYMMAGLASANVYAPRALISEILVDSAGNWTIEMGFFEGDNMLIDSVWLETSSGSSRIAFYVVNLQDGDGMFDSLSVITIDNLVEPVSIYSDGDLVRLVSYGVWSNAVFDEIAFGDYPGSYLDCMQSGESVMNVNWDRFCMDNSPTIGSGNNTGIGYLGNFSGYILDPTGNPITGGYVEITGSADLRLYPDSTGFFNSSAVARRHAFDTIRHCIPPWPLLVYTYTTEPIDFCLRPDSAHYQDIICTSLVMGIEEEMTEAQSLVTIAPNPFKDQVSFYFKLNGKNKAELFYLSVFTLDGKQIDRIAITSSINKYEWKPQNTIPTGILVYQLEKDGRIVSTGKFAHL